MLLPGKSHEQRSLIGYSPWGRKESDMTEQLHVSRFTFCHKCGVICISEVMDISPVILIPACASSSPAFLMMYSAHKLNKQGDIMQP